MVEDEDGLVILGEREVVHETVSPPDSHSADAGNVTGIEDAANLRIVRLKRLLPLKVRGNCLAQSVMAGPRQMPRRRTTPI